jgi:hypothetical protein
MGRKVSDEFTPPLCEARHRHNYDEIASWARQAIDPADLRDGSKSVPATATPPKPKKSLQTKPRRPVDIGRSAFAPGFLMR